MPKLNKEEDATPKNLQPFITHGLDLNWRTGDEEATGDCPWCGREGKFSVNIDTSKWQCFICQETGNSLSFLRVLWDKSFDATTSMDYAELTRDRKLVHNTTLMELHLARSIITRDWLIPGYTPDRKLATLYRYCHNANGRMYLLPTKTMGHQLLGMGVFDPDKPIIDVCEGMWDLAAWWEILGLCKRSGDKLAPTASRELSLLAERNVIGIPTANGLNESHLELFEGKIVNFISQNDHERKHPVTGKPIQPASLLHTQRAARMLSEHSTPPQAINYLPWGDGLGYDPSLKSGYDVRDALNANI